jgi:hypothetical protein
MPEQTELGTYMSVRPLTEDEQKEWPDGEVTFTINYGETGTKAHAVTTVKEARSFMRVVEQVCQSVLEAKEPRDELGLTARKRNMLEAHVAFIRCRCGILFALKPWCILKDASEVGRHVCLSCGSDVFQDGTEVAFADAWKKRESGEERAHKLLPENVVQVGEGRETRYTHRDGRPIDIRS